MQWFLTLKMSTSQNKEKGKVHPMSVQTNCNNWMKAQEVENLFQMDVIQPVVLTESEASTENVGDTTLVYDWRYRMTGDTETTNA
jgi:hypothetical protein